MTKTSVHYLNYFRTKITKVRTLLAVGQNGTCFFCGSPARRDRSPMLDFTAFHCVQCGHFRLANSLLEHCSTCFDPRLRQRLSALITEWNLKRQPRLAIIDYDGEKDISGGNAIFMHYQKLLSSYPRSVEELLDRALLNLSRLANPKRPNAPVVFDRYTPAGVFFAQGNSQIEIANNVATVISELTRAGYAIFNYCVLKEVPPRKRILDASHGVSITEMGWERLLQKRYADADGAPFAYVAMGFNSGRDTFFNDGIKPAIEAAHVPFYQVKARRLQHGPDNEDTCDAVLSEVRKCAYLIADVSSGQHGVFQEAGIAQGLGVPVIWIVEGAPPPPSPRQGRESSGDRAYNYVVYDSPRDLQEKLKRRIVVSVPLAKIGSRAAL